MTVSGWFVLLVALGVVPIVLTGDPLVMLGWLGFCVVLVAVDLAIAGSPRAVSVSREIPSRVRLGETVAVKLVLDEHRAPRRAGRGAGWVAAVGRGIHEDDAAHHPQPRAPQHHDGPDPVPSRHAPHRPRHRAQLGAAAPRRAPGDAGSARARSRCCRPFNSRKHLPSRLARLRELDGATSVMVRGQGTEFDSLRDYVRGDDVRSIDWRATARRSDPTNRSGTRLVVRTWRPERDRRVVIIIDSGRTSAARIDNEPRIDTAFESALLLAALASSAGDRVDLVIFDRRVRGRVQGATGADLLSKMVSAMAPVEPVLIESDWAAVPALVRSVTAHRALVVLATTIDAPGAASGLLSVLPQLTRKHMVVVSSVTDPDVLRATTERQDRDEVYRAAAAERAMLDQARVAAAIRQLGAEIVTGAPQDLPPALADRYIALKAAGLL